MSTSSISQAVYQSVFQAVEALTYIPGQQPANIVHSETSLGPLQLNGSSSPPVAKVSVSQQVLSAGALALNLYTGLTDGGGNVITPTGLSVRAVKVQNPNPAALAVTPGGSNPYPLTFTVPPWSEIAVFDTGAGLAALNALTGTTSGTSNGVWLGSSTKTLTPSSAPGWTAHELIGWTVIIDGLAFVVSDNSTTAITTTANNSLGNGTYGWSILPAANVQITSTCCNLALAGVGSQTSNWTVWLG